MFHFVTDEAHTHRKGAGVSARLKPDTLWNCPLITHQTVQRGAGHTQEAEDKSKHGSFL